MLSSQQKKKFLFFYIITFCIRFLFAANVPLIDDEAYHWSWSRELSWSYFDHPGMIAWLDWLSGKVFGTTYWAVRFPSFVCYSLTVYLAFRLARELFNEWAGHFVAFILLWSPFWGFGGYVNSPEPPFMMFWILAATVFWQGMREDDRAWPPSKTWILLGIVMGLGLNSKFITALLAPGFGIFLISSPKHRKQLQTPWPWIGILIAALLCYPIFKWNMDFDWPGFRYQFHDRHQDGNFNFEKYLGFLGAQVFFLTPFVFYLMILVVFQAFKHFSTLRWKFVLSLAAPPICVFYTQALFSDFKPHWSGGAYLILCLAAGFLWSEGLRWKSQQFLKPFSRIVTIGILAILIPLNLLIYTPFVYPWFPKAYGLFKNPATWNSEWDVTNEFFGWEEVGAHLNALQSKLNHETGRKPFLAAHRYETTAQAYWGTQQKVITLNRTRSHYTITTSQQDLDHLRGQDALLVHSEKYPVDPHAWIRWDSCTQERFPTYRHGIAARMFTIYYCKNFQGIFK